jgi:hypothetical protein
MRTIATSAAAACCLLTTVSASIPPPPFGVTNYALTFRGGSVGEPFRSSMFMCVVVFCRDTCCYDLTHEMCLIKLSK